MIIFTMKFVYVFIFFLGLYHSVSKATECTSRGRFPNDDSEHCRGYTICLMMGATNFTSYKLTCPEGSVYSHLESQCTTTPNYKCVPTYNCTQVGNFESPSSENCTSFIACVEGTSNIVTARQINCPPDLVFNKNQGVCVNSTEFQCNEVHVDVKINVTDVLVAADDNGTVYVSTSFSISGSVSNRYNYVTVSTITMISVVLFLIK